MSTAPSKPLRHAIGQYLGAKTSVMHLPWLCLRYYNTALDLFGATRSPCSLYDGNNVTVSVRRSRVPGDDSRDRRRTLNRSKMCIPAQAEVARFVYDWLQARTTCIMRLVYVQQHKPRELFYKQLVAASSGYDTMLIASVSNVFSERSEMPSPANACSPCATADVVSLAINPI